MMSEATAATPEPEPPALRLERLLRANLGAIGRLRGDVERSRQAATSALGVHGEGCRDLATLLLDASLRQASTEYELRENTRRISEASIAIAVGELLAPAPAAEPEPGRRARHRAPSRLGKRALRVARVLIPAAALGAALRRSWSAHAPAVAKVALARSVAHPVLSLAGAGTAVVLAAGVAVVPGAASAHEAGGKPAANPPASIQSAVPIPSGGPFIAASARHPKLPKLDARSSGTTAPGIAPVPPYYGSPPSQPSQPSQSSPSSQQSGQSGTATLDVSGLEPSGNIDLSSGASVTLTLSVQGSGWVHWSVNANGASDLDFSGMSGVLTGSETYSLTVSVDAAQALDGNTSETFSIGSQSITAALPQLAPAASPTPAPTDTAVPTPSAS